MSFSFRTPWGDARARLSQKLKARGMPLADAIEELERIAPNRAVHVREIERLLDEQVTPAVTANLRAAGGAEWFGTP